jgi:hypothetical protein
MEHPSSRGSMHLGFWAVLIVTALLLLLAGALTGCPGAAPEYDVEVTRDLTYGVGYVKLAGTSGYETKALLLDVYYPEGNRSDSKPAMVLIHGGRFREGDKEKPELVDIARFFTRRGYVCFSISYRLLGDDPPGPDYLPGFDVFKAAHAALVDSKAAVRYVRARSDVYGIDPDSIIVLGESAGAIAALTVAVTDDDDYLQDTEELGVPAQNHPGVSSQVAACVDLWGSANHILDEFDRRDPPIMVVHGEEDREPGASFAAARLIHGLLELYGIPHEFYAIEDEGHGAWDARANGKGLNYMILDFLNEHVFPQNKLLRLL